MNKTIKLVVDVGLLVSGLISLWSGLVLWLFLPSGRRSGLEMFWGITKYQWSNLHLYLSLLFMGLVLIHFVLNWRVFKSFFK